MVAGSRRRNLLSSTEVENSLHSRHRSGLLLKLSSVKMRLATAQAEGLKLGSLRIIVGTAARRSAKIRDLNDAQQGSGMPFG